MNVSSAVLGKNRIGLILTDGRIQIGTCAGWEYLLIGGWAWYRHLGLRCVRSSQRGSQLAQELVLHRTLFINLVLQYIDLVSDDTDLLLLRVELIDLLLVELAPQPPLKFVELQGCLLLEVSEIDVACNCL